MDTSLASKQTGPDLLKVRKYDIECKIDNTSKNGMKWSAKSVYSWIAPFKWAK